MAGKRYKKQDEKIYDGSEKRIGKFLRESDTRMIIDRKLREVG